MNTKNENTQNIIDALNHALDSTVTAAERAMHGAPGDAQRSLSFEVERIEQHTLKLLGIVSRLAHVQGDKGAAVTVGSIQ